MSKISPLKRFLWKFTPEYPDYWVDTIRSPLWRIGTIVDRTKVALRWAKFGWFDNQWNTATTLGALRLKLKMLHESEDHADSTEVMDAYLIIDRIIDDPYLHEASRSLKFNETHGETIWIDSETGARYDDFTLVKPNRGVYLGRSKVVTEEQQAKYHEDCIALRNLRDELAAADRKRLFAALDKMFGQ